MYPSNFKRVLKFKLCRVSCHVFLISVTVTLEHLATTKSVMEMEVGGEAGGVAEGEVVVLEEEAVDEEGKHTASFLGVRTKEKSEVIMSIYILLTSRSILYALGIYWAVW